MRRWAAIAVATLVVGLLAAYLISKQITELLISADEFESPSSSQVNSSTQVQDIGPLGWRGGEVEQLNLTWSHYIPPSGYGLYIYELPGDLVSQDMLTALEDFNCAALHQVSASTPGLETKALMLLPVRSIPTKSEAIDLALSRQILRVTIAAENARLIYIVITGTPILYPEGSPGTAAAPIVIEIPGEISPPYVIAWLSELRQKIEAGDIATPNAFGLEFSSLLYQIGGVGGIAHLWIQPATASAPPSCS